MAIGPAAAVVGPSQTGAKLAGIVMVLNRNGREAGFCTGIVLSRTAVLTAAHCTPSDADLRVHFPAPGEAPVLLPVAEAIRHPDYRADAIRTRQRSVDLALLRLPAPLPTRFTAATLAETGHATVGAPLTLSGYGVGHEGDAASSGRLRSAALAVRAPLSTLLLWAEDPNRQGAGACTGDSGAPVFQGDDPAVAAVAVWSAGIGSRSCGDLTQAVWVAPQRGWIDGVLKRWGAPR